MMRLLQDQKEVWKFAKCTGGSMMKKHQQFPVVKFKKDSPLKLKKNIRENSRITRFHGM